MVSKECESLASVYKICKELFVVRPQNHFACVKNFPVVYIYIYIYIYIRRFFIYFLILFYFILFCHYTVKVCDFYSYTYFR